MATEGRLSQEPVEALVVPSGIAGRLSQEPVEALVSPTGIAGRLSQEPIEALVRPGTHAFLSQLPVEVAQPSISTLPGYITHQVSEALQSPGEPADITQQAVDVAQSPLPPVYTTAQSVDVSQFPDEPAWITQQTVELIFLNVGCGGLPPPPTIICPPVENPGASAPPGVCPPPAHPVPTLGDCLGFLDPTFG